MINDRAGTRFTGSQDHPRHRRAQIMGWAGTPPLCNKIRRVYDSLNYLQVEKATLLFSGNVFFSIKQGDYQHDVNYMQDISGSIVRLDRANGSRHLPSLRTPTLSTIHLRKTTSMPAVWQRTEIYRQSVLPILRAGTIAAIRVRIPPWSRALPAMPKQQWAAVL